MYIRKRSINICMHVCRCLCSKIVWIKCETGKCVLRDRIFVIARAKLREEAVVI